MPDKVRRRRQSEDGPVVQSPAGDGLVRAASDGAEPSPISMDATPVCHGLLKVALALYGTAFTPIVKDLARKRWGEAAWLERCKASLTSKMQAFVTANGTWDAFTIGSVLMRYLGEEGFMPPALDDGGSESLR